jgi:hypothetical protein
MRAGTVTFSIALPKRRFLARSKVAFGVSLFTSALMTGAPDMAPPIALALRAEMEAALIKPEVKELEPMWA